MADNPAEMPDIQELLADRKIAELTSQLEELSNDDLSRLFSELSARERVELMRELDPEFAADVLNALPFALATDLVEDLSATEAAPILEEMHSQDQADFVSELDEDQANAILAEFEPDEAAQIRAMAGYDDFSAGGLMDGEFVAFPGELTVSEAVATMRKNAATYADYQVQYAYVVRGTPSEGQLIGVLRLRDLLLAPATVRLDAIMIADPVSIATTTDLDDLREFFDEHSYLGVPVVDEAARLVGVLNRASVEKALGEKATDDYLKTQGLIREELRSLPLWTRSSRRLLWLTLNIVLNFAAASVIAIYQETLEKVIAIAVFLPIISDMSGCSGNQAVAVSMRELSLGLISGRDLWKVLSKEVAVGLINGAVLGTLVMLVAWMWKGEPALGMVVGIALMCNTLIAVCLGGTLPLLMRRLKMDPALASGPLLTTATDLCGFLISLSLTARFLV
ncbi:MAG: magnesium transporter [Pirellulaceae bacterium]